MCLSVGGIQFKRNIWLYEYISGWFGSMVGFQQTIKMVWRTCVEAAWIDLYVFFLIIVQKNELLSVLYKGTVNCFLYMVLSALFH